MFIIYTNKFMYALLSTQIDKTLQPLVNTYTSSGCHVNDGPSDLLIPIVKRQ